MAEVRIAVIPDTYAIVDLEAEGTFMRAKTPDAWTADNLADALRRQGCLVEISEGDAGPDAYMHAVSRHFAAKYEGEMDELVVRLRRMRRVGRLKGAGDDDGVADAVNDFIYDRHSDLLLNACGGSDSVCEITHEHIHEHIDCCINNPAGGCAE